MVYKIPPSSSPDDRRAVGVLGTILSGGRSSRFYESIVRQKQLSTGVSAGTGRSRGPGLFRFPRRPSRARPCGARGRHR